MGTAPTLHLSIFTETIAAANTPAHSCWTLSRIDRSGPPWPRKRITRTFRCLSSSLSASGDTPSWRFPPYHRTQRPAPVRDKYPATDLPSVPAWQCNNFTGCQGFHPSQRLFALEAGGCESACRFPVRIAVILTTPDRIFHRGLLRYG